MKKSAFFGMIYKKFKLF